MPFLRIQRFILYKNLSSGSVSENQKKFCCYAPFTAMAEKIQKHLDTQRDRITDMYINRKLPINEIHRELVHFKLPWFRWVQKSRKEILGRTNIISENQLRYAIKRWGLTPPATANPPARGNFAIADPSNRHISAPAGPITQNIHNQARQPGYHSLPTEWMRTSAIGVSATMAASFRNEPMQMYCPNYHFTEMQLTDHHQELHPC